LYIAIGLVGANIILSSIIFGAMFCLFNRQDSLKFKSAKVAPIPNKAANFDPFTGNPLNVENNNGFGNNNNNSNNSSNNDNNTVISTGYRPVDSTVGNPELIVSDVGAIEVNAPPTPENNPQFDPRLNTKQVAIQAAQTEATDQEKIAEREIKKAVMARKKAEDLKKTTGRSDAALKADQAANMQERIAQREAMKARVARIKAEELSRTTT